MRDPNRIPKILKLIRAIWKKNPDLRLMQLLVVIAESTYEETDLFYLEDDDLKTALERFRR